MRTTLLRLAVALATFGLGVALAALFWQPVGKIGSKHGGKREACNWRERAVLGALPPPPPAPVVVTPIAPLPPNVETLTMETCEGSAEGRMVSGGVINGKAIAKPAPAYPAPARTKGVSGTVVVQITVDECGEVEEAEAISGHPLLREAAEEAACEARFAPTRLNGAPVKVTGTITYNFVLE